jgi:hypothetical protein
MHAWYLGHDLGPVVLEQMVQRGVHHGKVEKT